MLTFAEKYNWWTAKDQKKDISVDAKVEYVLECGSLVELRKMLREVGGKKIFAIWEDKIFKKKSLKGREKVLQYFVEHHKDFTV